MSKSIIAIILALSCGPAAAMGEYSPGQYTEPTGEQKEACMPDAFKFCSAAFPDHLKIVECLVKNKAHLSPTCRAVIK
jgi:hypothetical protein